MRKCTLYLLLLIFSVFFLVFTACTLEKKSDFASQSLKDYSFEELANIQQQRKEDLTLVASGFLKISIDSLTHNPIIYPFYFDSGLDEYFAHYNSTVNGLDIYNLTADKLYKRILFPSVGPMSISRKSYPFIKSLDSIFIWTHDPRGLFMIDSRGYQKSVYGFSEHAWKINVNMVQRFYIVNDQAIFAYQPPFPDVKLRDSSNFLIFNLGLNFGQKSTSGRPRSVTDFPLYGSDAIPRLCLGHNNSIINFFGAGPLIIQTSLLDGSVKYHILRSKYQNEPYTEPEHDGSHPIAQNQFLKGGYFLLEYDRYRHLYYLMCLLGEKDSIDGSGIEKTPDDMQLSIIIADTLFRYRGEILLPKRKFFRSMFVTKEGLMVSDAYPEKSYKERTLSYVLFKVVPKKNGDDVAGRD